jgi:nucleoside-diphosphate-sugar epimerase
VHLAVGVGGYEDAPDEMVRATVGGTVVLLEAAHRAGIERFVLVSSSAVVTGYPRGTWIDASTPPSFAGLYGLTKWLQEEVGRQYAAEHGMVVPILRPWVIVDGPTRRMRLGGPLDATDAVGHDGPFGWVDRTDFAEACALALTAPLLGAPVFHLMPNPIGKRWFDTEPAERLLGWRPRWDFAGDVPDGWTIPDAVPAEPAAATPPSLRTMT